MKEQWKDIEGYDDIFQVSNLGRIRSNDRYVKINGGGIKFSSVLQFSIDMKFIRKWSKIADACKETGADPSVIVRNCKGKGKSAGGYIWKYAEDLNE